MFRCVEEPNSASSSADQNIGDTETLEVQTACIVVQRRWRPCPEQEAHRDRLDTRKRRRTSCRRAELAFDSHHLSVVNQGAPTEVSVHPGYASR
jgi:hypothetical protein